MLTVKAWRSVCDFYVRGMFFKLLFFIDLWFKTTTNILSQLTNKNSRNSKGIVPRSVNYHFTRQCNYQCGFCFHTAKTSFVMPLLEAKKGLKMLKEAGMEKVNFSGGEPFITQNGHYLGELVRYCKEELHLPSVSIVSNGSLIREKWFRDYGEFLDILAISCDSFDEETNREIGRGQGNRNHVQKLLKIHDWCREYHVAFKINTVVNTKNVDEDMAENIMSLNPIRWKHFYLWGHMKYVGYATPVNDINDLEQRSITGRRYLRVASAVRGEAAHDGHFEHSYRVTNVFQCLLLEGENVGKDALRHAEQFYISDDQFQVFLDRHKHVPMLVSESNTKMQNSYLILDEYMRFLDCREGAKRPSPSLLDVGVANALDKSGFDEVMFRKRGGEYKWSKADMLLDW